MKYDPVEDTPKYKAIKKELEEKIKKENANEIKGFGYCHKYWQTKKKILKRDYNIDWRSPAELNPFVLFD